MFRRLHGDNPPRLYLYDVTSAYLEGSGNEYAAFGYNRDGKKGKRQIVVGLLCDEQGVPLSIEVFRGNTSDVKTVASQVRKVAERFGGGEVTFVGDRGMLKSRPVEDITAAGFHYITAITKPQIEALLRDGVIQMSLFDEELAEIVSDDGVRYVLRRNPVRACEIERSRRDKLSSFRRFVERQNAYLAGHPRSRVEVALRKAGERLERLGLRWVEVKVSERVLEISEDASALAEVSKLDGCYVLKTDLPAEAVSKETVHARYKDLSLVERAFRTGKSHLELRPVYVRLASRTRGHAFVVMLSYRIVRELEGLWRELDVTVSEGISALGGLCAVEVSIRGERSFTRIPAPRDSLSGLLSAAGVRLPDALPCSGAVVATRKKPAKRRSSR